MKITTREVTVTKNVLEATVHEALLAFPRLNIDSREQVLREIFEQGARKLNETITIDIGSGEYGQLTIDAFQRETIPVGVQSETRPGKVHTVQVSRTGIALSCTCEDFTLNLNPYCKHMSPAAKYAYLSKPVSIL